MDMTRLLRPLGLVTLASLVLALIALIGERPVNAVAPPQLLLADYAAQIDKAQKLEVTHGRGLSGARALHVSRTETGWTVDERWNYPANDELVNETLLALADLKGWKRAPRKRIGIALWGWLCRKIWARRCAFASVMGKGKYWPRFCSARSSKARAKRRKR